MPLHRHVHGIEPRVAVTGDDAAHGGGVAEPVVQDHAVRQGAVPGPQPARGRQRGELIAAQSMLALIAALSCFHAANTVGRWAKSLVKLAT